MARARIGRFTTPAAQERYEKVYDEGASAFPSPVQARDVDTGFGRVRVYQFGQDDRPPIVLLHGRGATSVMWLPNLAALAEHRRVYTVDLLGVQPGGDHRRSVRRRGEQPGPALHR
ncbi:alpha/beta fold hydrolase [Acrocarpospora catenulata]|uniref:alpha/beta fold hydrolase n=1 Tax=Acrocarpospora catenulata TaxID=2836182 RepID=UPI001BDB6798|nr:alpha/beta fold hydrolase [Acrocarpospora catenulata]